MNLSSDRAAWAIATGEYPPQAGGVSDYTRQVAEALSAKGDDVQVWAPPTQSAPLNDAPPQSTPREGDAVSVNRLADHFGKRGLGELEAHLRVARTSRLLVQYVPHAFGCRAMNVRFCRWVRRMARAGRSVDVMFHEVAYPLEPGQPLKHKLLALVNRQMARWLAEAADRIFISIPGWEKSLRELGVGKPVDWLPVPSNVAQEADPAVVAAVRARYAGGRLIAHFGTYGSLVATELRPLIVLLAQRNSSMNLLLLGRGGDAFAASLSKEFPQWSGRIHAPGALDGGALANHLAAADLAVQPYPDGISCRRSSAMAALALGVPVVSCAGHNTEAIWAQSGAVALAASPSVHDLVAAVEGVSSDPSTLAELQRRGRSLYRSRFDLRFTIGVLRGETAGAGGVA